MGPEHENTVGGRAFGVSGGEILMVNIDGSLGLSYTPWRGRDFAAYESAARSISKKDADETDVMMGRDTS